MMRGLMMDAPLMISGILRHAALNHGGREIVTRLPESGEIHRYGYRDAWKRSQQTAHALTKLGVAPGERVGTIAWNTHRHFELYYAVSGIESVIHTINPRLKPEQIAWIVNHAEDKVVCFDVTFAPIIDGIAQHCPGVEKWVLMAGAEHKPEMKTEILTYEELIADEPEEFDWPVFDEHAAACLCYTSGTTGDPKGVLYSHRSTVLHAMSSIAPDVIGGGSEASILAVVPMFHVSAWGLPYGAPMAGAKLVMPGAQLDGASLYELIDGEDVTYMVGVPTVWLGVLDYLRKNEKRLDKVEKILSGGSALPEALLRAYEEGYGVTMQQGWGMTEMSPIGTIGTLKPNHDGLPQDEKVKIKLKQGLGVYGVELRVVSEDGKILPRDGKSSGHLQVRGPWIASQYFKRDSDDQFTDDGWFDTGDIAHLDDDGYMTITDRAKDVIKTGGEWISSIDLENAAMGHPEVAQAAAIGLPHPKWQERPLLVVVPKEDCSPTEQQIQDYIAEKCAKWWVPDAVEFVEELPLGATGKVLKTDLRERFKDYKLGEDKPKKPKTDASPQSEAVETGEKRKKFLGIF